MSLTIQEIDVRLNNRTILSNLNLSINNREYIALLGPSGSGKTTLLKTLAGLITPTCGDILIDQHSIRELPSHQRPISVVFQDLRLFPHYNVWENIAFPMKLKGLPEEEINKKIQQLLSDVQLAGYEHYPIQKLSGGQQQRIALVRALAADPKILLLDEPFSGLDEPLRREMGQLVYQLHQAKEITTILVTHDKREALEFADRIAFLNEGNLVQVDTGQAILRHPNSAFIANFFGRMNSLTLTDQQIEEWEMKKDGDQIKQVKKSTYQLMVRPSQVRIVASPEKQQGQFVIEGQLVRQTDFSDYLEYQFKIRDSDSFWYVTQAQNDLNSLKTGEHYFLIVDVSDFQIY